MLEWPDGFGLSVQFFGIAAMLVLGPALRPRLQSAVPVLIFGAAVFHYAWIRPSAATQSGIFAYDQTSLAYLLAFLAFLFLSEGFMRPRASRLAPEGAPLKICLGFLGSALLLANNLSVIVVGLPGFFLLATIGPSVTSRGQRARSGLTAVTWTVLLLCLLCVGAGFFVAGGGPMRLDSLLTSSIARNQDFILGWSLICSLLSVLVFFFSCGFLLQDSCDSADWNVSAIFRIAPMVVFSGLLFKWCKIDSGLPPTEVAEILAAALSVLVVLIILFGRNLLLVLHAFALVPLTTLFWSLAVPKAATHGMAALFIFALAISRLIYLMEKVGVAPGDSVKSLHEVLRAASFGLRMEFFMLGLSLMPLGTFLGVNFFIELPLIASICGASLTFAIVLFLGRILKVEKVGDGSEVGLNQAESAIGVITLAALIVLGIYPTPLYNYIDYLSHHL